MTEQIKGKGNQNAKKDNPKSARINFRCTPELKEKAEKAAAKKGVKLQDFLADIIEKNC